MVFGNKYNYFYRELNVRVKAQKYKNYTQSYEIVDLYGKNWCYIRAQIFVGFLEGK